MGHTGPTGGKYFLSPTVQLFHDIVTMGGGVTRDLHRGTVRLSVTLSTDLEFGDGVLLSRVLVDLLDRLELLVGTQLTLVVLETETRESLSGRGRAQLRQVTK